MQHTRAGLASLLMFAACGDDGTVTIVDAGIDATPDVAIDASTCFPPSKVCGSECIDVSDDEANCGDCGVTCNGGEVCDTTCACPPPFVGASLAASSFDQLQGMGGTRIAINPNLESGGINPFIVGYDAATPRDADINLAMGTLGQAPFVAAGYGFSIDTMEIDAVFVATAGTLHLSDATNTHVMGTLTNATFQGVTGGFTNPTIDPNGCTFTVATVAFEMCMGACP